ncbi:MAG: lipoyl(octanoyl) transferase LipB [Betaproteobacteria bacterium]|nr:lipoyl(octanoyl) transferase LipB [Betaproteobacteria bacterium]
MSTLLILRRGLEPYEQCFAAMRSFTDARDSQTQDQLWLVEHPPVFTLGLGADPAHVINAHHLPVVQTDRGGEVTYHGPGQAIAYLLFDLRRDGRRLLPRDFVYRIEQAVIDTLDTYNCAGERKAGAPGIYIADGDWRGAKVAALGLKIRANGCTYHGVSLNVAMDLQPFGWINPCGYAGLATIDLHTLGVRASLDEVQDQLARALEKNLKL